MLQFAPSDFRSKSEKTESAVEDFECPISLATMADPVIALDGHS